MSIYPNSIPEFRILEKNNGTQEFQVRYINIAQGYVGKWTSIKIEKEDGSEHTTNP